MLSGKTWIRAAALVAALMPGIALAQPFRLILTHLEPPLVPNSVMDLALELGYFEQEGVEVELVRVQQTPSALAALQAGEGEMANVGLDAVLQLHAQGVDDLIAVGSPNKSLPFLIAARDDYAAATDLEGARFGVGRIGSLDHSLSMNVLSAAGLDVETLEILSVGQPDVRAQALAVGQIDATTMSIGVWLALPDKDGLHVLIDQAQYYDAAPVINKVNVVPRAVLEERREEVEAVMRALVRISRDFAANPSAWAEAMEDVTNVSREDLEELARTFEGSWSVNGGFSASELQFSQDWLYETEDFVDTAPVELAQWADFSVMDAVLEDLGVDESADLPER